jgi:hypothetical protein
MKRKERHIAPAPGMVALLFLGPSSVHLICLLLGLCLSCRRLQDHGCAALPAVDLCDTVIQERVCKRVSGRVGVAGQLDGSDRTVRSVRLCPGRRVSSRARKDVRVSSAGLLVLSLSGWHGGLGYCVSVYVCVRDATCRKAHDGGSVLDSVCGARMRWRLSMAAVLCLRFGL